ncbi:cbb3-type cytochrome c oxidase subunit I, partial [Klebsiella pneumoniae]|uniref:cbb3-type cytochrome c oxidase subunit I n=1 Tax=Klebsiella pneumoniae TaxID=573 RepID=UPI0028F41B55
KIFNWLFTMYQGRIVFNSAMMWTIGFIVTFSVGGMTGVLLAVAYVPQGREIFPRLTVEENLLMGLSRFPAREAQQVPEEIYQL